jgi:hypothetical protein
VEKESKEKGPAPQPPIPFPVLPTPPASPLTPPSTPPIPFVPPSIPPPVNFDTSDVDLKQNVEYNITSQHTFVENIDTPETSRKLSNSSGPTSSEIATEQTLEDVTINSVSPLDSGTNLVVVSTPPADRSKLNTSTITIISDLPDLSNSLATNISQVSTYNYYDE